MSKEDLSPALRCARCDLPLAPAPVKLSYLGHSFTQDFPRCPGCGELFIPEEIVTGKIQPVEITLEDK